MNMLVVLTPWLQWFAIAITLAFGVWSFLQPKKSAESVFFSLQTSRATAEYRIGFGGMLIGICSWIIYSQDPAAFKALGFIWLGAAIARGLCFFIDQPKPMTFYWAAFVFEVFMAACLLVG
jgi:Domain of unknown function (DUF4345)